MAYQDSQSTEKNLALLATQDTQHKEVTEDLWEYYYLWWQYYYDDLLEDYFQIKEEEEEEEEEEQNSYFVNRKGYGIFAVVEFVSIMLGLLLPILTFAIGCCIRQFTRDRDDSESGSEPEEKVVQYCTNPVKVTIDEVEANDSTVIAAIDVSKKELGIAQPAQIIEVGSTAKLPLALLVEEPGQSQTQQPKPERGM